MNVAIIIRRLNVKGGAQRQALSLARELKKMGHGVRLYAFAYDKEKCFSDLLDGLPVTALGFPDAKRLALVIDKNTDILHPHDQEAYKVAYYFKKLVKNIPSVWMMNDVPSKDFGFWKEHQFNPALQRSPMKRAYHLFYDIVDRHFIGAQEKIAVLDNWNRDLVKRYFKKDAEVARSGLDILEFPHAPRALSGKAVRLLCAGIFFPHRRFEDVVEALRLLRSDGYDASLTIVGDHDNDKKYYEILKNQISKLQLSHAVRFVGKVSDSELKKAYQTHDVFIFPNHLQTWGLAVFEAMSSGIPVIVSRTTGASEVLTDKENALLVNPKTPEEIRTAVHALARDPQFYEHITRNARTFVEQNISWKKYAERMLDIFNRARY